MAKQPAELPIRIIRERGRVRRNTYSHEANVRKTVDRPSSTFHQKEVITHRANEQSRVQGEQHQRRVLFRSVVTEESLRRRRIAAAEQRREGVVSDIGKKSGVRSAGIGATAGIIRVFVVLFLLSMLFLVVSKGEQAGNAIQKVGYFLNNITSSQPLFKKAS